jgi:hypothetical protein
MSLLTSDNLDLVYWLFGFYFITVVPLERYVINTAIVTHVGIHARPQPTNHITRTQRAQGQSMSTQGNSRPGMYETTR